MFWNLFAAQVPTPHNKHHGYTAYPSTTSNFRV